MATRGLGRWEGLTKTVTAKLEVVGIDTGPVVTQVECSFAWIGCTWVTVRHKHLCER